MSLKRHQKFRLEAEKKWTEKWFKFVTSKIHWKSYWISKNPNLTMEFIEEHLDYDWDWYGVSKNPNLTVEFIEDHLEYD